jgi:pimeloyl-ACP methyl ester carboxylesterase
MPDRRPDPEPRRDGARLVAAAALVAAGGWALARLLASLARDAAAYRRDEARLRDVWAEVAGARRRARVATRATRPGEPPIVLVHGFGVSSAYWVPLAARLAERHAVYVLDLRAEDAPEPDDVRALAALVVAWLDALAIGRATLVGNSLGCQTVVETAVEHPERVAALVLVGPTVDPAAHGLWRQAGRLAASAPFERPWLDGIVLADYARAGPRALGRELRALLHHRMEQALPRVAAPTLVIRGAQDRIVPRRWAAEAAGLAGGTWVEIADAGHAAHFDEPDAVARAVERFLAAPAGAGSRPVRTRGDRAPAGAAGGEVE